MDFDTRILKLWENTIKQVFNGETPHSREWHDNIAIIDILNKLGSTEQLCHMLYPNDGGFNITGAKSSLESGCIEILTDIGPNIVKPKKLSFHFFGEDNFQWAYFRLETSYLAPCGVYEDDEDSTNEFQYEEVTELRPGKYVERYHWDAGYYGYDEDGEKPLPREARVVRRYFEGTFAFFATTSIYNKTPDTYDGRHNKMSSEEFEKYIRDVINYLAEKGVK